MRIHADSDIQPCMDKKYFCRIRIQTFSVASAPERDWLGFYAEIQVVFDTVQNKFVNTCYTLAKRLYRISKLFHHLSPPPPFQRTKGGKDGGQGRKMSVAASNKPRFFQHQHWQMRLRKIIIFITPTALLFFVTFLVQSCMGVIYSRGSTFSQIEILEIEYIKLIYLKRLYTYFDIFWQFPRVSVVL